MAGSSRVSRRGAGQGAQNGGNSVVRIRDILPENARGEGTESVSLRWCSPFCEWARAAAATAERSSRGQGSAWQDGEMPGSVCGVSRAASRALARSRKCKAWQHDAPALLHEVRRYSIRIRLRMSSRTKELFWTRAVIRNRRESATLVGRLVTRALQRFQVTPSDCSDASGAVQMVVLRSSVEASAMRQGT